MNVREVHEFLNEMWESIFTLNEELKAELPKEGFKVEDVEEVFGAYIFLDGEWRLMKYPHPAFEVKPQIEVGATPEAYYFVVAVPKDRISEDFVGQFIELFPRSFIYGAQDFLSDAYNWRRDGKVSPGRILEKIKASDEGLFQFEANFESVEELKEGLLKLIEVGKRLEIFDL